MFLLVWEQISGAIAASAFGAPEALGQNYLSDMALEAKK